MKDIREDPPKRIGTNPDTNIELLPNGAMRAIPLDDHKEFEAAKERAGTDGGEVLSGDLANDSGDLDLDPPQNLPTAK